MIVRGHHQHTRGRARTASVPLYHCRRVPGVLLWAEPPDEATPPGHDAPPGAGLWAASVHGHLCESRGKNWCGDDLWVRGNTHCNVCRLTRSLHKGSQDESRGVFCSQNNPTSCQGLHTYTDALATCLHTRTQKPRKAYPAELAQFHTQEYVDFLSKVSHTL
jgi:hypothetical protein